MTFDIQIEDDNYIVDSFVTEQNTQSLMLHEWQKRAMDYFFDNDTCAIFSCATGTGKTHIAIQIMKKLFLMNPKIYVLIVVPKNVILEKQWFPELYANGFTPADVGVYYGAAKEVRKITITNMQNIGNLDLSLHNCIILDELHNYGGKRLFKILSENNFEHMLGLSATINRLDNRHWELLKMFRYNIFNYTPEQALHDGILNQFNFININVKMEEEDYEIYNKMTQDLNVVMQQGGSFSRIMKGLAGNDIKLKMLKILGERKQLVLNYPLKMDVLKLICSQHKNEKTIVFNSYNKTTNDCYFNLLDVGVKAKIFHSGKTKEEREQILNAYKNDKFNVLLTTNILDEGYNLPSIAVAVVLAGNSTARQTIQRLGRVLRKKETKSLIYQVFVKDTMEEMQALERADLFKKLCSDYKEYKYTKENGLVET